MRGKKVYGECKLCGKQGELTFEHVPPKSAFNKHPVKLIEAENFFNLMTSRERLPWETDGIQYRSQQQGLGGYYLCQSCNNNTGTWYVDDYVQFAQTIVSCIRTQSDTSFTGLQIKLANFRPLPFFKAVMTMFCDINEECFGDDQLRNYLLTKETTQFDCAKYRVFMFIFDGKLQRMSPLSCFVTNDADIVSISEIAAFPLGFALYIDCPETYKPQGVEITYFGGYEYNQAGVLDIAIPKLSCNTHFPGDYRDADVIESIIRNNQHTSEGN